MMMAAIQMDVIRATGEALQEEPKAHARDDQANDQDDDHEVDISVFLNGLRQVNEGSFALRNEDIRELEPAT